MKKILIGLLLLASCTTEQKDKPIEATGVIAHFRKSGILRDTWDGCLKKQRGLQEFSIPKNKGLAEKVQKHYEAGDTVIIKYHLLSNFLFKEGYTDWELLEIKKK